MKDIITNFPLYLEWSFRLAFAAMMGFVIGYEREHDGRPAGLRTHILVTLGSSLVMVISFYLVHMGYTTDITRLSAQVISGIGFLGAGSIIKSGTGVKGLTTAATLWIVACIGLAAGSGFLWGAGFVTLITYITLRLLKKFENRFISTKQFSFTIPQDSEKLAEITSLLLREQITVLKIAAMPDQQYRFDLQTKYSRIDEIISDFSKLSYVKFELVNTGETKV